LARGGEGRPAWRGVGYRRLQPLRLATHLGGQRGRALHTKAEGRTRQLAGKPSEVVGLAGQPHAFGDVVEVRARRQNLGAQDRLEVERSTRKCRDDRLDIIDGERDHWQMGDAIRYARLLNDARERATPETFGDAGDLDWFYLLEPLTGVLRVFTIGVSASQTAPKGFRHCVWREVATFHIAESGATTSIGHCTAGQMDALIAEQLADGFVEQP
jgi:hypothetical protein